LKPSHEVYFEVTVPEMAFVPAESVPAPEIEHEAKKGMLPCGTDSVIERSLPVIVPASVPVYVALRGLTTVSGPDTVLPTCVATQVTVIDGPPCEPGTLTVPDHVPARLRTGGFDGAVLVPPQAAVETRSNKKATRMGVVPMSRQ
jgi:hypothetical protein